MINEQLRIGLTYVGINCSISPSVSMLLKYVIVEVSASVYKDLPHVPA
jgi:hypothetical protein